MGIGASIANAKTQYRLNQQIKLELIVKQQQEDDIRAEKWYKERKREREQEREQRERLRKERNKLFDPNIMPANQQEFDAKLKRYDYEVERYSNNAKNLLNRHKYLSNAGYDVYDSYNAESRRFFAKRCTYHDKASQHLANLSYEERYQKPFTLFDNIPHTQHTTHNTSYNGKK